MKGVCVCVWGGGVDEVTYHLFSWPAILRTKSFKPNVLFLNFLLLITACRHKIKDKVLFRFL